MAMHSGIGLSKILILVGAGYTGSIVLKNGRLSDILADLQTLLKDKPRDDGGTDSDYSDVLAAQVRRLAMEVRQLASSRSVTILNGDSSAMGSVASLAVPAAALGALGYGYMWWKGLSFSDLMYVTKRNMANAVESLTKNLEDVTAALAAAKRHLTQRIENLDGKLDEQKEMSKLIKDEGGKIDTLEDKQDFANSGIYYLLRFVSEKDGRKVPEFLQFFGMPAIDGSSCPSQAEPSIQQACTQPSQAFESDVHKSEERSVLKSQHLTTVILQDVPKPSNKRGLLGSNLKGLTDALELSLAVNESKTSAKMQNNTDSLDMTQKALVSCIGTLLLINPVDSMAWGTTESMLLDAKNNVDNARED
ncbi:hypothetical protein ACLOJK_035477 [Asimina triloba]